MFVKISDKLAGCLDILQDYLIKELNQVIPYDQLLEMVVSLSYPEEVFERILESDYV